MRPGMMVSQCRSLRRLLQDWMADCRGIAATEFAFIVPLMLVLFFGTVEFCSAIAIDRKVTLMARTLSDLTSQSITVGDSDMTGFFGASNSIMYPYDTSPVHSTITELYVDPTTHKAVVKWSKGFAPYSPPGSTLTNVATGSGTKPIPTDLLVDGTYLILSEVSYKYVPTVGYLLAKAGIILGDYAFTRPRQSTCVKYSPSTVC
jgi:Flp pilus assembly protein TadG